LASGEDRLGHKLGLQFGRTLAPGSRFSYFSLIIPGKLRDTAAD